MESKLEEQTCEETHRVYAKCEASSCWLDFEIARRIPYSRMQIANASWEEIQKFNIFI